MCRVDGRAMEGATMRKHYGRSAIVGWGLGLALAGALVVMVMAVVAALW